MSFAEHLRFVVIHPIPLVSNVWELSRKWSRRWVASGCGHGFTPWTLDVERSRSLVHIHRGDGVAIETSVVVQRPVFIAPILHLVLILGTKLRSRIVW